MDLGLKQETGNMPPHLGPLGHLGGYDSAVDSSASEGPESQPIPLDRTRVGGASMHISDFAPPFGPGPGAGPGTAPFPAYVGSAPAELQMADPPWAARVSDAGDIPSISARSGSGTGTSSESSRGGLYGDLLGANGPGSVSVSGSAPTAHGHGLNMGAHRPYYESIYGDEPSQSPQQPSQPGQRVPSHAFAGGFDIDAPRDLQRRRRASHNAVERRRRDTISEKIKELGMLIPDAFWDGQNLGTPGERQHKSVVLRSCVDYLKDLQDELDLRRSHELALQQRVIELERIVSGRYGSPAVKHEPEDDADVFRGFQSNGSATPVSQFDASQYN